MTGLERIFMLILWGSQTGAVGSALGSGPRGRKFESSRSDQKKQKVDDFIDFLLFLFIMN